MFQKYFFRRSQTWIPFATTAPVFTIGGSPQHEAGTRRFSTSTVPMLGSQQTQLFPQPSKLRPRASPYWKSGGARRRGRQQLSKLVDTQACVPDDAAHRKGVDGVAARDSDDPASVRHHDVFALANNAEARFLQGLHGLKVGDPGQLSHS